MRVFFPANTNSLWLLKLALRFRSLDQFYALVANSVSNFSFYSVHIYVANLFRQVRGMILSIYDPLTRSYAGRKRFSFFFASQCRPIRLCELIEFHIRPVIAVCIWLQVANFVYAIFAKRVAPYSAPLSVRSRINSINVARFFLSPYFHQEKFPI